MTPTDELPLDPQDHEAKNPYRADNEPDQSDGHERVASTNLLSRLRIWPAVLLLAAMGIAKFVPLLFSEMSFALFQINAFGPALCAILLLVWWVFFSRATRQERWLGGLAIVALLIVAHLLADKSVAGFGTIMSIIPWTMAMFAITLVVLHRLRSTSRTIIAGLMALATCGYWDMIRIDGVSGDFEMAKSWRWQPTDEDIYLQHLEASGEATASNEALVAPAELLDGATWPAFRGANRDSRVPGVVLNTDWNANPPREVWRVKVGPGWSSFAVAGNLLFTQEQRGDAEAVVCLDAQTGQTVWAHTYASRFWESIGGAGPRATPTLADDQLFALGGAGMLHRIDPLSGQPVWQRDLREDAERDPPMWGFASSPLVIGDVVIVHAGGKDDRGVLAYDRATGELRWSAPSGNHSYSSPQLATLGGSQQILMLTNDGISLIDPIDGSITFEHVWEYEGHRVVQPQVFDGNAILLGTSIGAGTRRIDLDTSGDDWTAEERWTSLHMKPDFNDFVVHKGFLYGFDPNVFACVELETGERKWKKGRYGSGQVLLLPDADQLLVISETGELVLLAANSESLEELGRYEAIDGKTWNHPVIVGNRLFVRNGIEAACFELATIGSAAL